MIKVELKNSLGTKNILCKESIVKIGKDPKSHIVLSDGSRMHAVMEDNKDGKTYTLIDLGSADGTKVNGIRYNKIKIKASDEIYVYGNTIKILDIGEDILEEPPQLHRVKLESNYIILLKINGEEKAFSKNIIIGNKPENETDIPEKEIDIFIDDIRGLHSVIKPNWEGNGLVLCPALKPGLNLFFNGRKITRNEHIPLKKYDVIDICDTTIEVLDINLLAPFDEEDAMLAGCKPIETSCGASSSFGTVDEIGFDEFPFTQKESKKNKEPVSRIEKILYVQPEDVKPIINLIETSGRSNETMYELAKLLDKSWNARKYIYNTVDTLLKCNNKKRAIQMVNLIVGSFRTFSAMKEEYNRSKQ